jgi:hypothetical protein
MRAKAIEASLVAAIATTWMGGCSLLANLAQFDGATAVGPPDVSDAADAAGV